MKRVRGVIEAAGLTKKSLFSAIYCQPARENDVDLAFELCPTPRVFEWNLMHHDSIIPQACVDIDGVLCEDPTDEQNDDGPKVSRIFTLRTTAINPHRQGRHAGYLTARKISVTDRRMARFPWRTIQRASNDAIFLNVGTTTS